MLHYDGHLLFTPNLGYYEFKGFVDYALFQTLAGKDPKSLPPPYANQPFSGEDLDATLKLPLFLNQLKQNRNVTVGDIMKMISLNRASDKVTTTAVIRDIRSHSIKARLNSVYAKRELPAPFDCIATHRLKFTTFDMTRKEFYSIIDNGLTPQFKKRFTFLDFKRIILSGYISILNHYYLTVLKEVRSLVLPSSRPRALQLLLAPSPLEASPQESDTISKILDRKVESPPHIIVLLEYLNLLISFQLEFSNAWNTERVNKQTMKQEHNSFLALLRAWEETLTLMVDKQLKWSGTPNCTVEVCKKFQENVHEAVRRLRTYNVESSHSVHPDLLKVYLLLVFRKA